MLWFKKKEEKKGPTPEELEKEILERSAEAALLEKERETVLEDTRSFAEEYRRYNEEASAMFEENMAEKGRNRRNCFYGRRNSGRSGKLRNGTGKTG